MSYSDLLISLQLPSNIGRVGKAGLRSEQGSRVGDGVGEGSGVGDVVGQGMVVTK